MAQVHHSVRTMIWHVKTVFCSVAVLIACASARAAKSVQEFAIVRDGRAVASFSVEAEDETDRRSAEQDLDAFRRHVHAVTGVGFPTNEMDMANEVAIRIEPIKDIDHRFDWRVEFPSASRMRVTVTRSSLMDALVRLLEVGADARFLGSEPCMFQFEPCQDLLLPQRTMRSPTNGFSLNRGMHRVCGYKRELGFVDDRLFEYSHGVSKYAFPSERYKKGLPESVAPLVDGRRLVRPAEPFNRWQPCYTSPETVRLATRNILGYLKSHPDRQSVTLGVNDNGGYCECDACKAADAGSLKPIFSNVHGNRSASYYGFVNAVAATVVREFPHVRIGLLAYGETIMPPPFRLPDNVVPMMTLDTYSAAIDEKTAARHSAVIAEWGGKARTTGVWEYCWGRRFSVPRVDFAFQARRMKELYAHGARAYFGENSIIADALDGPKLYLTSKLVKDIDADPKILLDEWFVRFAGKAAEPALRKLYGACERYWKSPDLSRTPLKAACNYVYMYPNPAHLYGVRPGFPMHLRRLAEEVRAASVTSGERDRADLLVRHFELLECEAAFLGAEWIEPEHGELKDAKTAVRMLADFNRRRPDLESRWTRVCAFFADPPFAEKDVYLRKEVLTCDPQPKIVQMLMKAAAFSDDAVLRRELEKTTGSSAFGDLGTVARRLLATNTGAAGQHELIADADGRCSLKLTRNLSPGVWCARARVKTDDARARAELFLWRQKGGGGTRAGRTLGSFRWARPANACLARCVPCDRRMTASI